MLRFFEKIGRYGAASALSLALTLGLPIFSVEVLGVQPEPAVAFSFALAFVVNFISMKFFVYKNSDPFGSQVLKFIMFSIFFRVSEYLIFSFIIHYTSIPYSFALFAVVFSSFAAKYFMYSKWLFSESKG